MDQAGTNEIASSEQERIAFIQEAVRYAQEAYKAKRGTSSIQETNLNRQDVNCVAPRPLITTATKAQNSRTAATTPKRQSAVPGICTCSHHQHGEVDVKHDGRKNKDEADVSLAMATRIQGSGKATLHGRQPTVSEIPMCSHHQQAFERLKAEAYERRRILQSFRAANANVELAINEILYNPYGSIQSVRPLSSARVTNRNLVPKSSVAVPRLSIASPSNTTAKVLKSPQTPIIGHVAVPRRSLGHRRLDSHNPTVAVNPSHTTRPVEQPAIEGTTQMPENVDNTSEIIPDSRNVTFIKSGERSDNVPSIVQVLKSKKATTKLPNHSTLSLQQFEDEMSKIIPIVNGDYDLELSDADFGRITLLLRQANLEEQSLRPRTYALLRITNATNLIDDFVKRKCFHIALPYSNGNLPRSLSPEQRRQFLKKQTAVMTKVANIEGGLQGKHANFVDNADSHLQSLNILGKGGYGEVDRVRSKLSRKIYVRKRLKRSETFEESA